MSLAENNPNESHKQGANNICQIVLNFVPLDKNGISKRDAVFLRILKELHNRLLIRLRAIKTVII